MNKQLKPCPFCGKIPQVTHDKSLTSLEFNNNYPNNGKGLYLERDTYSVECTCCQQTKKYFTEEEAAFAWNRRTQPENKPLSNFGHITKSPEVLANYLFNLTADYLDCNGPYFSEDALNWLNQPEQEEK